MPRRPIALAVVSLVGFGMLLTGCTSTVALEAAKDSNDPLCADVSVRLPAEVAGEARRWTDAQATGAWGTPTKVILTCGVTPPGPSELRCESVDGVDWIVDESDAPRFRVTTFGRTPAVQVFFDTEVTNDSTGVSSRDVLDTLSPVVASLPKDGECVAREDATPAP